jgi:hypothetical protein
VSLLSAGGNNTMTRVFNRQFALRLAGRSAVALPAVGATVALAAGSALAAPTWVATPTPDQAAQGVPFSNVFNAVSARTSTDTWAVGTFQGQNDDDGLVMLAEHWNGTAWSQVPTPNVVRFNEKLNAVSASAPNDAWAVGSTNMTGFAHTDPITAHWNGQSWTIVPTPATTGGSKSILFGVANLGGGNVWAVGRSEANRALIEHWNGSAWTIVPAPVPTVPAGNTFVGTTLTGISARSANDIWAVGYTQGAQGTNANKFTLTMHWNGSTWTVRPSPNPAVPTPAGTSQALNGVVAISANDAWAVGGTSDISGFQPSRPIAMHWNGTTWSLSTVPNIGTGGIASVTANSSSSVWAAGGPGDTGTVLHWNGTSWAQDTTVPVGPSGTTTLRSISAVPGSATEVWAAGNTLPAGGMNHAFAMHRS